MLRILTPLAAACLLASASQMLHASPYSSLIVFGDSLSDAGQFPDTGGPNNATRRYTNRTGPDYQDGTGELTGATAPILLGRKLGLGEAGLGPSTSPVYLANGLPDGNNWAVGGYTTSQIYDSVTSVSQTVISPWYPGAGTVLRERPGYLASTGFRADPNALYYLSGGGNDFLGGLVLSPVQAQEAAGRFADSVQALQQAGARYMMVWLLPDLSKTPVAALAYPTAAEKAGISFLSSAYNDALVTRLEQTDAEIIPLNAPTFLAEVLASPAAYGFASDQDLTGTCFNGGGFDCIENAQYGINGATPDPTKLLFNDSVHPTTALQALIADYAYSLLAAPWEVSLLPEMAHSALRAHQDQLRSQWQADWEAWQAVGQWRPFITAGGQRQGYDLYGGDADGDGYSLNVGGSYRLDNAWRVGLAAAYYEQEMDAGSADSEYQLNAYLGSLFAQYQANRWWGEVVASIGSLDYDDLSRKFDLGPVTRQEQGDTDGDLWSVGGRIGYDIAQLASSPWHLSPFLSADYARVEVDGYAEDGSSSSALNFGDQKRTSKRLGVGLQGLFDLSQQTRLFGEVAMEREYEDDPSDVDMAQKALPTLGYTLEGVTPDDKTWRATLGARHQLSDGLSLRAGYTYRKGDDSDQQGVNLSLAWDL